MTRTAFGGIVALSVLTLLAPPAMATEAGKISGAQLFQARCTQCHLVTSGQSTTGPSLQNLIGRKAGSLTNWEYTAALKASNITWTPEVLEQWLASPHAKVPETGMPVPGIKDATERAALVEYLKAPAGPKRDGQ